MLLTSRGRHRLGVVRGFRRGACAFHVTSDGPVFAVALHGATLLSGAGSGNGVCVWGIEAQRVVARLHGRSAGSVCALAFDGKRVACGDSASLVPPTALLPRRAKTQAA